MVNAANNAIKTAVCKVFASVRVNSKSGEMKPAPGASLAGMGGFVITEKFSIFGARSAAV